jgi:hypothetical protein
VIVYVAGSSSEPERVRAFMDAVQAIPGARLAHDWLAPIERGVPANEGLAMGARFGHASDDLAAIQHAHAFVLLAPEKPTRGAWVEFGYALAVFEGGRDHVIVAGRGEQSIFCALGVEVGSDDNALAYVRAIAMRRAG